MIKSLYFQIYVLPIYLAYFYYFFFLVHNIFINVNLNEKKIKYY